MASGSYKLFGSASLLFSVLLSQSQLARRPEEEPVWKKVDRNVTALFPHWLFYLKVSGSMGCGVYVCNVKISL